MDPSESAPEILAKAECSLASCQRMLSHLITAHTEISDVEPDRPHGDKMYLEVLAAVIEAYECMKRFVPSDLLVPFAQMDIIVSRVRQIQGRAVTNTNRGKIKERLNEAIGMCRETLDDCRLNISQFKATTLETAQLSNLTLVAPREAKYDKIHDEMAIAAGILDVDLIRIPLPANPSLVDVDQESEAIQPSSQVVCDVSEYDECVLILLGTAIGRANYPPLLIHDRRNLSFQTTLTKIPYSAGSFDELGTQIAEKVRQQCIGMS